MYQPNIQIGLERFYGLIELGAESCAEEFIQDRSIKTLDKTIGLWTVNSGGSMLNIIELKESS